MQAPSVTPPPELQLWRILSEPDFFHLIFDALPLQVAVKSTRPETFGRFMLWNRVAEEWMGLPGEHVIGRTDYDFFPKEQADFFLAKDREVVASRQVVDIACEPILSHTRGERFFHTVKTPFFDNEGHPLALLAVSEDITERVRAEALQHAAMTKLRESEKRWQLALASTEAGVWDWDIRGAGCFIPSAGERSSATGKTKRLAVRRDSSLSFIPTTARAFGARRGVCFSASRSCFGVNTGCDAATGRISGSSHTRRRTSTKRAGPRA